METYIHRTRPMGILVAVLVILLDVLVVFLPTIVLVRASVTTKKSLKIFFGQNCWLRFLRLEKNQSHLVPRLTLLSSPPKSLLPLLFRHLLFYGTLDLLQVTTSSLLLGNNSTMLSARGFSVYLLTSPIIPLLSVNQYLSQLIIIFRRSVFNLV